ncbi:MAG: hypothetical protein ACWGHO_04900 [Candidatus Moraniibacteriota bacterium]
MNTIINFFNHPFFIIVGGIATIFMIVGFCYTAFLVVKGVFPVWYRLGIGLSKRKIAIFAKDEYQSLSDMITASKIFTTTIQIHKNDIKKAEKETIYLVHWNEFQDKIEAILSIKKDTTPLIIYAPQEEGFIDKDIMKKINSHRNSVVVNLRGRLLNDILTSLITTSYEKR